MSPSTLLRAQHVVGAQELGAAGRNGHFSLKSSSSGLKSKLFKLLRVTAVQLLCVACTPVSLLWVQATQVSAALMPCVPYLPVCLSDSQWLVRRKTVLACGFLGNESSLKGMRSQHLLTFIPVIFFFRHPAASLRAVEGESCKVEGRKAIPFRL